MSARRHDPRTPGADGASAAPTPRTVGSPPVDRTALDLTPLLGQNLSRLRTGRRLSLDRLSELSGVSRAMLSQVELGNSTPTINILSKISAALEIPFALLIAENRHEPVAVLRAETAKILSSHDGRFRSRALFPFEGQRRVEFYELLLAPVAVENAAAHPLGTVENLVVAAGALELSVGSRAVQLAAGDAVVFRADEPHTYRNTVDEETRLFLVMTYAEAVT